MHAVDIAGYEDPFHQDWKHNRTITRVLGRPFRDEWPPLKTTVRNAIASCGSRKQPAKPR